MNKKHLLLVRHAKSDWGNSTLGDFDRPLNERGRSNAPVMARRLADKGVKPQLIVSSPALRARSTAASFAAVLGINENHFKLQPAIYEASSQSLLSVINKLDDRFDLIALFGHNPGITDLANDLCEAGIYNLPTCGTVLIEFPFDSYSLISKGTGKLVFVDYPKKEA